MNLQYVSDEKGNTTGVFIPIKEWNLLKKKYLLDEDGLHFTDEQKKNSMTGWTIS